MLQRVRESASTDHIGRIFLKLILTIFVFLVIAWNLLGATIPFMAFLRYFDLFWVAPVVQGKDAYASMKSLQIEFWSCLREFPKEEKKEFVKDRVRLRRKKNLDVRTWLNVSNYRNSIIFCLTFCSMQLSRT